MQDIQSSEVVADSQGRQYHLGLAPGELAENIILVGDPGRAERAGKLLDDVHLSKQNREYLTVSGHYRGLQVSVVGTGIGADNTEIAVIEACQLTKQPTFIRCGSCGALKKEAALGDLVVSQAALRMENTSLSFVDEGYPAVSSFEVTQALLAACQRQKFSYHLGLTATLPGFYGCQGRAIDGFPLRDPELLSRFASQGVLNFEMETSCLFSLAGLRGVRAGAVCTVFANREEKTFIPQAEKAEAETRCLQAGLEALLLLQRMEKEKTAGTPVWLPAELLK